MGEPLQDGRRLSWLWTAFAFAWLLVLIVVVWRLPTAGFSLPRLGACLACLALVTASYVWLTVVKAPRIADLTTGTSTGAHPSTVVALAAMAGSVFVFTLLAPGLALLRPAAALPDSSNAPRPRAGTWRRVRSRLPVDHDDSARQHRS